MKTRLVLCAAALLAVSAFAGSEQIIKQRAKELRDQNNVRQGVPPPSPSVQAAPAASSAPALTPQQMSLQRLQADLEPIKADCKVTPQQKQRLAADLIAAAHGPTKPSLPSATRLAEDLSTGLAAAPVSATHRARLLQDLMAVLNPPAGQQAPSPAVLSDVQAIFQADGLSRKDAVKIADSLKAVGAELQKPTGK